MNNNIIFEVLNTLRDPETQRIKAVFWLALLPDSPLYAGIPGSLFFQQEEQPTKPYSEVTREEVVGWIKQHLLSNNPNNLNLLEQQLNKKLNTLKPLDHPILLSGIPPLASQQEAVS